MKTDVDKLLQKKVASKSTPAATFHKTGSRPLFKGGRPAIGIPERGK